MLQEVLQHFKNITMLITKSQSIAISIANFKSITMILEPLLITTTTSTFHSSSNSNSNSNSNSTTTICITNKKSRNNNIYNDSINHRGRIIRKDSSIKRKASSSLSLSLSLSLSTSSSSSTIISTDIILHDRHFTTIVLLTTIPSISTLTKHRYQH